MTQKSATQLLEGAYALETAQDNHRYYKDFAAVYDDEFADAMGYQAPLAVAQVYRKLAKASDQPVADIGCGTGLAAQALDLVDVAIDGFDISPEMIARAREKHLYRAFYQANLKQPLDDLPDTYGALISSGTFTLGHLGPEDLVRLLDLLIPGGLVCITISKAHFDDQDFQKQFDLLELDGVITQLQTYLVPIYTKAGHDHQNDMTHIVSFRKS